MWWIIILVLIAIIIKFLLDSKKVEKQVASSGGLKTLYPNLAVHLRSKSQARGNFKETDNLLSYNYYYGRKKQAVLSWEVYPSFSQLTITCEVTPHLGTKRNFEWFFRNGTDDQIIIKTIDSEIKNKLEYMGLLDKP